MKGIRKTGTKRERNWIPSGSFVFTIVTRRAKKCLKKSPKTFNSRMYNLNLPDGADTCGARITMVSRQQCERQKCERHQCEARSANANSGYPDNSAKDRSANDTSAKPEVRMPTVRTRQQCEWDKSAKVKCAKARSANATLVRTDKTPKWLKSCEAAVYAFLQDGVWFKKKKKKKNSLSLSPSVSLFLSQVS